MSVTPLKPKTVSFQLPGSVQLVRASTAPAKATRYYPGTPAITQPHRTTTSSPAPPPTVTSPTAKPDLIADIFEDATERPKAVGPALGPTEEKKSSFGAKPDSSGHPEVVEMKEVYAGSERLNASKQDERILSGQAKVSKAKVIKPHRSSLVGKHRLTPAGQAIKAIYQVREQTNVSCLDYARWMKHDVAKLREHLVKIEEEIKLASKAKGTLDSRIFDLRKCLSVNQQSLSAQQKKSHREVSI